MNSPSQSPRFTRDLLRIALLLVAIGILGFVVAASGIVPIKASSEHWAITRWFLQFSKQRSVATHSIGIVTPRLDQSWLMLKGAGHYEFGCRPCHGSPELRNPKIAQGMTPIPPYLPETVSNWDTEELFYLVKHGIKLTGMPAWPSQKRDDEVWAMVAFLREFPQLDNEEYRRLVHGDDRVESVPLEGLAPPENIPLGVTANCGRCHGVDGRGRGSDAYPKLAGQSPQYLIESLKAFALGERHSGIMEPIAAALAEEDIDKLGQYYGQLPPPGPASDAENADETPNAPDSLTDEIRRGESIARLGVPQRDVPACYACHGPSDLPRNPNYPLLAGQPSDYIELQLKLFQREQRGGTAYSHVMHRAAKGLNGTQISDVARYYSSLKSQ